MVTTYPEINATTFKNNFDQFMGEMGHPDGMTIIHMVTVINEHPDLAFQYISVLRAMTNDSGYNPAEVYGVSINDLLESYGNQMAWIHAVIRLYEEALEDMSR